MNIAPAKRSASLAERHALSLIIFPDNVPVTPGASLHAFVSTPALSFPSLSGSLLNRS